MHWGAGEPVDPAAISGREQFADALKAAAACAGLSVRQVAERAGANLPAGSRESNVPYGTIQGWFSGTAVPDANTPFLTPVLIALGVPAQRIPQWHAAAARVRRIPRPAAATRSPYRGLNPFEPQHTEDFFGRTELIEQLCALVRRGLDGGPELGVIVVLGSSGAGKTSLLRAGLAVRFRCLLLTPGADPIESLAAATRELVPDDEDVVLVVDQCEELWALSPPATGEHGRARERWERDRRKFLADLAEWARRPRSVVVIGLRADHFGHAADEPLLSAALAGGRQVVVTPMNRRQLSQVIEAPAARRGIQVDPALVERLLEELSVTDLDSEPGALPLLSYALEQTWAYLRPPRKTLRYDDYHRTGGIRGAIEKTAEQVYAESSPAGRLAAKRVLTRCVAVTEESTARRTALRSELVWDDLSPDEVDTTIGRFAAERLLTVSDIGVQASHEALLSAWARLAQWIATDRASLLEHRRFGTEAREWDRGGRAPKDLLSVGRTEDFAKWAADAAHERELNPLEREFLAANIAFHAEQAERERRRVAELNETVGDLRLSRAQLRRRARVLQQVAVMLAVVTVIACGAVFLAVTGRNDARSSAHIARIARNEAFSRLAAVQSEQLRARDPALAQQLALVGLHTAETVEARSALLDSTAVATPRRTPTVRGTVALALTADRRWLAVANSDGAVRLFDRLRARDGPVVLVTGSAEALYAIAFAPDDRRLVVGGLGGATLWDTSSMANPRKIASLRDSGPVYDLAWAPDGHEITAATTAGAVRWQFGDDGGVSAPIVDTNEVTKAVAYSPDGRLLATGSETGIVRLRSRGPLGSETGTLNMPRPTDGILDLQFDPASTRLAVGSQADECTLIDITEPENPTATAHLGGFTSYVNSVAFHGATIIAGSSDNSVRIFDLAQAGAGRVLPGPSVVTSVLDAGDAVISAATDGFVREWAAPGPVSPNVGGRIYTLPASADSSVAAVGVVPPADNEANVVHRFDLSDRAGVREQLPALRFDQGSKMSGVAAVSGDGRIIAAGTLGGEVYAWDVTDSERPRRLGSPIRPLDRGIAAIALSPNGRRAFAAAAADASNRVVAVDLSEVDGLRISETLTANGLVQLLTVSADGTLLAASTANGVNVWDISGGRAVAVADLRQVFGSTVTAAKFGTGRLLAAGSDDRTIKIWDFATPDKPVLLATITGPAGAVESLTFDPSGHRLAAGIGDNQVWLWDVAHPANPQPYAALDAYSGRVNDVAFSPDGARLVAAGFDGTLRTWQLDSRSVVAALCADKSSVISIDEWRQYFPSATYADPCGL